MVTDLGGHITQNVVYIPYGEVFVEERNGSWASPYLFNAKELDEETGLYYYGARYLNPSIALWLSTDPLQGKYPGMSPYNYCAGNPVKLVDPDGEEIRIAYMVDGQLKFEKYRPGATTKNKNVYVQRAYKALNHIYSYRNPNDGIDGKTMIDILCNDDNKIMVKITNIELFPMVDTKYRQNKEGDCYIQATVGWNPLVGSNIVDNNGNLTGEKQSPATLLLHELGHILAIWFDSEGDSYDLAHKNDIFYHNEAERKVVQGVESSAARYWGEGLRENHWIKTDESGYYCTTDPTSNQKLRPEKEIEP